MLITIGIIILILGLMILTVYLILKGIMSSVNEKGKEYFTLKLSELDKKNTPLIKEEKEEEKEKIVQVLLANELNQNQDSIVLYQSKNVNDFDVKDILQFIKKIDAKFNYDERYIVEEFVNQTLADSSDEKYNKLIAVKKYIEKVGIYKLLISSDEEMDNFKSEVNKIDDEIITIYEKINGFFDLENFIAYLDIEIRKSDPTIYVLVGNKNVSFNDVSDRVKTMYREEVYRGIKIIYKGNIYDYSLG